MKTEKINHIVNESINGVWFGISAALSGFIIFLGKKLVDWLFDASVERFEKKVDIIITKRIDFIVDEEIKPLRVEITEYRNSHHGTLQKNEAVLNEALDKLDKFQEILEKNKL